MKTEMKEIVRPTKKIIRYKRGVPRLMRSVNMPTELFDRVQADADNWTGGNFSAMVTQIIAEYYLSLDQNME